jgi:PAS domain S-box-containing protein
MGPTATDWLKDQRLAAHALSPMPVWLWSADATHILWANPSGAAIFERAPSTAITAMRFDVTHPAAAQVHRLSWTLPNGTLPRLEKLRGFGAGIGGTLTCVCSRITLAGGIQGILIVATERAGPDQPLDERLRRLTADLDRPFAVFTADGDLRLTSQDGREHLAGASTLAELGAEALAQRATADGHADGEAAGQPIALDRLGDGTTLMLLMSFGEDGSSDKASAQDTEAAAASAPAETMAAPDKASVVETEEAAGAAVPPPQPDRKAGRAVPLRLVWQLDADDRFIVESPEFVALAGARTADALGARWSDFAAALALDPQGRIAAAIASRQTWSGLTVQWPIGEGDDRIAVDLSGLPTYDRDRRYQGYRGFGVVRDSIRLRELAHRSSTAPAAGPTAPPVAASGTPATILPFPPQPSPQQPTADSTPTNAPGLSAREQGAFKELARALTERLQTQTKQAADDFGPERPEPIADTPPAAEAPVPSPAVPPPSAVEQPRGLQAQDAQLERPILDRLPVGILIYRLNDLIYANRAFLDWTGYGTLDALTAAGGLDSLFIEPAKTENGNGRGKALIISTPAGKTMPVEGRLFPVVWNGDSALVLMLNTTTAPATKERAPDKNTEFEARRVQNENRELKAVLDTATDGVLLLDRFGRVLSANRSAEAVFGYDATEFAALAFGDLFAPESRSAVLNYLETMSGDSRASLLNQGKEVIGRVKQGGLVPLHLTIGRVNNGTEKLCAVFRDITAWKKTEEELIKSRQQAETASVAKSDFLAKISHEIRTPLNAIIGFSEMMLEERFGALGHDRYREYLRDIHASGGHLVSLLNDLLDLSKIESGKLDLSFTALNLNDLTQQCVAIMQDQANRERVIIRTSLPTNLPQIIADARSVRQILLNLLSNSIKFTGAGGQVIVSTTINDDDAVVLRVRDNGTGMSPQELQVALEPFRQLATSARWGASGTGLGLPITKALAEANHAAFSISSVVDDGTLVEVAFPSSGFRGH